MLSDKSEEPKINIHSREQLLYVLAEASEIEHNLMCCYLFAAFSLKTGADEGLDVTELDAARRWRHTIMSVAVEEMTHLVLVANLTTALGGATHFTRPNFPVGAGLYPSGVVVRLAPFDRNTLQHFVYLERPEGHEVPDGTGFASSFDYVRETVSSRCMPSAQDYLTVGHLYRALREGIIAMVERLGEAGTFIGDPGAQVGPAIVSLPGLSAVADLKSALAAIDTVVLQGEGTASGGRGSHYGRFLAITQEYDALVARNPGFVPHRPVATSPVMRRPPDPRDKVFVDAAEAAKVLDAANAVYGLMLRCLAQAFGRSGSQEFRSQASGNNESGSQDEQRVLLDCAIELMFAITPLAEALTALPASKQHPGVNAGITFAMLRDIARMPQGTAEWVLISERVGEVAEAAATLSDIGPRLAEAASALAALKATFDGRVARLASSAASSTANRAARLPEAAAAQSVDPAMQESVGHGVREGDQGIVRGTQLTLKFDPRRCIHARFCVLGLPHVYKANVEGPWIDPDAASVEANIAVAHNCPSGAIRYERNDGGPEEGRPHVNLVRLLENGPYAFRAPVMIDGEFAGFRATLCRCGASKNKPFCDGSHLDIGFCATGEPAAGSFRALNVRDGELEIAPHRNGPLAVAGNIEIVSGTGQTIMKTTSTRLCRCGQSANKPYCDGTHARIGFTT